MKKITWKTEKRKLSDLIPWDRNPRQLSIEQAEQLEESLRKFGLVDIPAINLDNTIIGGHQRSKVMGLMKQFGIDSEIDVRVPNRKLTEREVEELNIRLNKNTGSFDSEALVNDFNIDDLMDWGFNPQELGLEAEEIDYEEMWKGMPEFTREDNTAFRSLIVHFENEKNLNTFCELISQAVTDKTKFIWFPKLIREDLMSLGYVDDES